MSLVEIYLKFLITIDDRASDYMRVFWNWIRSFRTKSTMYADFLY